MKTKLVLWGSNATEEKILIALQLKPDDNKIDIWTFPEAVATDEFARQLLGDWRNDMDVTFPEENTYMERELSMTESLLPEEIKVEREDIITRAQTEWHFVVLSSKLNEVYLSELAELTQKIDGLKSFNSDVWNNLKRFWNKVQSQVRERNLLKSHADILRDNTNVLFTKLKSLRSALDDVFRQDSQVHHDKFMTILDELENRAKEGTRLPALFDELKNLQKNFRDIKLTRDHRSKVWERLDATFKVVKEKRFGPNANNEFSAIDRLTRRFNGLLGAIDKMQRSIYRDEEDLKFQQRKIDSSDGQLEAQIRQAKIKMTEERIRSKNKKLEEMLQTKIELEKRISQQKEKEARRQKQNEVIAAKAAAKEKIALKIAAAAVARKDDDGKLEKAAEAIKKPEKEKVEEGTPPVAKEVVVPKEEETPIAAETEAVIKEEKAAEETPLATKEEVISKEEKTPPIAVDAVVKEEKATKGTPPISEEKTETPAIKATLKEVKESTETTEGLDEIIANAATISKIINENGKEAEPVEEVTE